MYTSTAYAHNNKLLSENDFHLPNMHTFFTANASDRKKNKILAKVNGGELPMKLLFEKVFHIEI